VFGRPGPRRDLLRTPRCDYQAQTGDLFSPGKVEIELNAGPGDVTSAELSRREPILLQTSRVSFRRHGSLVSTQERADFRVGLVSGSARGMTYGTRDGWLELTNDVVIQLQTQGGSSPEPPVHLAASRLRYERSRGEVQLWGPIQVWQGNQRVLADGGMVYLDEFDRVTRAALEGNVRVSESSEDYQLEVTAQQIRGEFDPASRQLVRLVAEGKVRGESRRGTTSSSFQAAQVALSFVGARRIPASGMAQGDVRLSVEFGPRSSGAGHLASRRTGVQKHTVAAEEVHFDFRPGKLSLASARTVGPGTLVLVPLNRELGERILTAGQFTLRFDSSGRLEHLRGSSPSRVVFMPAAKASPGSSPRESTSQALEAAFDPATQSLETVMQVGDIHFRDGERQASAEQAYYVAAAQRLELVGNPRLWDDQTRISAERIVFDLGRDTVEGLGRVQSTHLPGKAESATSDRGEATHVLADRVRADRQNQFVHYEGHVRAWRGHDVLESSSLDIYRADRRVKSGSRVVTSHLQPVWMAPGVAASRSQGPVTITADGLEYFDAGREARYRGNVRLQTENITLAADRLAVYFSVAAAEAAPQLQRAVAEGRVNVLQSSRRATGQRAEYEAAAGKIQLTGGPPELIDADKGLTRGERLTFFIHDDRLVVDGGEKSPTLSKHRVAR